MFEMNKEQRTKNKEQRTKKDNRYSSLNNKLFIKVFNFNYLRKENVKEIFNNDKFNDSI